jgi:hypothetical protein
VHRTFRYHSEGISKSSVSLCGPTYVCVLFAERMSGGSLTYVRVRNRDGRSLTLAYVHSRGLVFWLLFSKGF